EGLKEGRLDLALDLTAEQAHELREAPGVAVPLPRPGGLNRRIYFLAVNHRHPLLKKKDLRLALAQAIDREALLDAHFRGPLGKRVHRALNGPYPAGSWACNPALKGRDDPYDLSLAKSRFRRVLEEARVEKVKLKLQYPSGDAGLEEAMTQLCAKVGKALPGLVLEPKALDARALKKEVEQTREVYHLAYYHYDFPDEAFWLWPLLGPGEGGTNYLGYASGPLVSMIQGATSLR